MSPSGGLRIQLLRLYVHVEYTRTTAFKYGNNPLLLMRYNNTVRYLHAAKPYLAGGRPEPLESTRPLPLYTLIYLVRSNTLVAQVLGLSIP